MPKRVLLSFACLVAGATISPAVANAAVPACGDVVTESITLTASLSGCASGLVVGADSITIDLNGRTLQGTRSPGSVGIDVSGRSGVTIRNGTIRGFDTGISVFGSSASKVTNVGVRDAVTGIRLEDSSSVAPNDVSGNTVLRVRDGIVLFRSSDRLVSNTVMDASGTGISCRLGNGGVISSNLVTRSGVGIFVFVCTADLVANSALANVGDGISRDTSAGRVERNVASQNGGNGIASVDSHTNFLRNVTMGNGRNGLSITDTLPDHGPLHTVTGHIALANRGYGIFTPLVGVIDGGGNFARANGGSPQCLGVSCS